ncbi:MAG: 4a-hydroxytetrahydrobiopterin dehydratase [Gammaproteobacteria bacterium]|nr:4a-hydroxytetrahydrobiopterin dehydratase [Gammaproteobacteria bacterium]
MSDRPATDLTTRRCLPCEGGVPPLAPAAVAELRKALHPDWALAADGQSLSRAFGFPGFARTMGFVNAVAWIAESEDHHPDLEVGYGRCLVRWSTHAVKGLTENDFICAAKVDRLVD